MLEENPTMGQESLLILYILNDTIVKNESMSELKQLCKCNV